MRSFQKYYIFIFFACLSSSAHVFAQNTLNASIGIGDPGSNATVMIPLTNAEEVAGVQFDLHISPDVLEITNAAAVGRASAYSNVHTNELPNQNSRVLLFDLQGRTIASGSGEILRLNFDVAAGATSDTSEFQFVSVFISDEDNNQLQGNGINSIFIVTPIANAGGPYSGQVGSMVTFNAAASFDDPAGSISAYEWDWSNDGIFDQTTTSPIIQHTFNETGVHQIVLRVRDNKGLTDTNTCLVMIGATIKVSGNVLYYNSTVPLANTTVTLAGDFNNADITDENGFYSFENLTTGAYCTVTPSKTGDVGDNTIVAYDASLALQAAEGLRSLTPQQEIAADADGNGTIQVQDALLIARRAIGLPPISGSQAGNWTFDPSKRSYQPLTGYQFNQDFLAIIIGDVDGNWTQENE